MPPARDKEEIEKGVKGKANFIKDDILFKEESLFYARRARDRREKGDVE